MKSLVEHYVQQLELAEAKLTQDRVLHRKLFDALALRPGDEVDWEIEQLSAYSSQITMRGNVICGQQIKDGKITIIVPGSETITARHKGEFSEDHAGMIENAMVEIAKLLVQAEIQARTELQERATPVSMRGTTVSQPV